MSLSIATNDFPDDRVRVVGFLQSMTGAGLILGPIFGSILYTFLGFKYTFFLYGGLEVLLAIIIRFNFPERKIHRSNQSKEFPAETLLKKTAAVRKSEAEFL